ncbi:hypothetical protein CCMA1212_000801 [Trichoderma ghanense]|uniref:Uncharacterized protein n=1 Tax=Trichoderma ghanense TaxID=65468 RepID=A0ABY2HE37_9HYPO
MEYLYLDALPGIWTNQEQRPGDSSTEMALGCTKVARWIPLPPFSCTSTETVPDVYAREGEQTKDKMPTI